MSTIQRSAATATRTQDGGGGRSGCGQDITRVCYPARIGYSSVRTPGTITAAVSLAGWHADVAQLVEHHLAKVRVAGSNPVVRSETPNAVGADPRLSGSMVSLLRRSSGRWKSFRGGVAEWFRQGPAKPCTRVRFPSPPLATTPSPTPSPARGRDGTIGETITHGDRSRGGPSAPTSSADVDGASRFGVLEGAGIASFCVSRSSGTVPADKPGFR